MLFRAIIIAMGSVLVASESCPRDLRNRWCYAGQDCFPGVEEMLSFNATIEGTVIFPTDENYHTEIILNNVYYTKFPAVVVFVNSTEDVQKSVLFARQYNLRVSIFSSGHDYIGRSTAHGSLMINFSRMNRMAVDLTSTRNKAGTATIESGASWQKVYKELDDYDRVIVGGSAHSVAQGGYTQGGGHSPICRSFGLAVDNVLEMTVVTSDGRIVTVNSTTTITHNSDGTMSSSSDTDLFWALRGGGGGTFGIVTKYTYKLHFEPDQMVTATFSYLLSYDGDFSLGKTVFDFYSNFIKTMPKEWGGYIIMSNKVYPLSVGHYGTGMLISFNHLGAWNTTSKRFIDQWENFHPEWRTSWAVKNVSSFWEYEKNAVDAERYSAYLMNTFVQKENLDSKFSSFFAETMASPITESSPEISCTGTHLGGKISEIDLNSTSVHPGFRNGLISMSCGYTVDPFHFHKFEKEGMAFYNKLKTHGHGVYLNEPSANMTDWKEQFWGPQYPRLLSIKQKWDPDNYFTCLQCVGSDLDNHYRPLAASTASTHKPPSVDIVGK